MPIYEYRCKDCEKIFERTLPLARYDEPQTCDCGSLETEKIMSQVGFVLRGGGWPGKAIKVNNQMARKNEILDRRQAVRMRDDKSIPKLVPNVGGERTDSWADAQKLAASKGKATSSYDPYVRKERSKA